MPVRMQRLAALTAFTVAALVATAASAQKKYDPGASDTEIKIGNIMPYSGPASAYGVIGKANDFFPIEQMQLMKFNGESWELFGEIINGEVGH